MDFSHFIGGVYRQARDTDYCCKTLVKSILRNRESFTGNIPVYKVDVRSTRLGRHFSQGWLYTLVQAEKKADCGWQLHSKHLCNLRQLVTHWNIGPVARDHCPVVDIFLFSWAGKTKRQGMRNRIPLFKIVILNPTSLQAACVSRCQSDLGR